MQHTVEIQMALDLSIVFQRRDTSVRYRSSSSLASKQHAHLQSTVIIHLLFESFNVIHIDVSIPNHCIIATSHTLRLWTTE